MRILKLTTLLAAMLGAIAPAAAQSALGLTFVAAATGPSGSGTATRTWAAAAIGNPSFLATRRVIIGFANASSGLTVSSCTIATIACDRIDNVGTGSSLIAFASAVVPTGTTGDIAITFSGTDTAASKIVVYLTDNSLLYSTSPVVSAPLSVANTTATPGGHHLVNGFKGGFAISILNPSGSTGTVPISGSGGTTSASASSFSSSHFTIPQFSWASSGVPAATGPVTEQWAWTTPVNATLAVAAWR